MKKLIIIAFAAMLLQACTNSAPVSEETSAKENPLSKASWILGSWVLQTPKGLITENWEPSETEGFKAISTFAPTDGGPFVVEQIRLVSKNDTIWYIATVPNQNDGEEVLFRASEISDHKLAFENPEHDFPQRIVYERTSDTTVLAYIEGVQNGQERREEFAYRQK